jgi:hypothetical protein
VVCGWVGGGARRAAALNPHRALAQRPIQLVVGDGAAAVRVEAGEDCVELGVEGLEAKGADGATKLLLVDLAVLVVVPLDEEVDHPRRRSRERVLERPDDVRLDVDEAAAHRVEGGEAHAQRLLCVDADLALAHEGRELAKVEDAVAVEVRCVPLHGVLPHAHTKGLLLCATGNVGELSHEGGAEGALCPCLDGLDGLCLHCCRGLLRRREPLLGLGLRLLPCACDRLCLLLFLPLETLLLERAGHGACFV